MEAHNPDAGNIDVGLSDLFVRKLHQRLAAEKKLRPLGEEPKKLTRKERKEMREIIRDVEGEIRNALITGSSGSTETESEASRTDDPKQRKLFSA